MLSGKEDAFALGCDAASVAQARPLALSRTLLLLAILWP
jgi:hypothetical protein